MYDGVRPFCPDNYTDVYSIQCWFIEDYILSKPFQFYIQIHWNLRVKVVVHMSNLDLCVKVVVHMSNFDLSNSTYKFIGTLV